MKPTLLTRKYRRESDRRLDGDVLLAAVRQSLSSSSLPAQPPLIDLMERRAALLAWFEPEWITAGERGDDRDEALAAVTAASEIVVTAEGRKRRLIVDVRRAALKRLQTREAMQALLNTIDRPANDPVQTILERFLDNQTIDTTKLPRTELVALLTVLDWFEGIVEHKFDRGGIRAQLAREDLLAPLRNIGGPDIFFGREAELDRMRRFVGELGQSTWLRAAAATIASAVSSDDLPLFVFGPGGVGKSSLVARFLLEHADAGLIFAYLDLDRPHLDGRRPFTLLAEAARQIGAQVSAATAPAQAIADDLATAAAELGHSEAATGRDQDLLLSRFAKFIQASVGAERPIPFIVDTFEQVQSVSGAHLTVIRHMAEQLQKMLPNVRPVFCGRVLPNPNEFPCTPLELSQLEEQAAILFLAHQLKNRFFNVSVGPQDLLLAAQSVKRTPLGLRLAAQLIAEHGVAAVQAPRFLWLIKRTSDEAFLYRRILDHLPPGPIRKLAVPGLVLRRLSPDIVRSLLADLCGLPGIDDAGAHKLFEELRLQVSLVEDEGNETVRHRPDVRLLMLPDLEREVGRETMRALDRAAVSYYASREGASARAEELYHLLRLGEIEQFKSRWTTEAGDRLRDAREDFPTNPEARVALALALGDSPDTSDIALADQAHWERGVAARVDILLRQGAYESAVSELRARKDRLPASRLYCQEAEALMGLRRYDEAEKIAVQGNEQALAQGDNDIAFETAHIASRAAEAAGNLDRARAHLQRALDAAAQLGRPEQLLRVAGLRARLGGATRDDPGLQQAFARLADRFLGGSEGTDAATLRALAAAAGPSNAWIERAVLRRLGVEALSDQLRADLAALLAKIASASDLPSQSARAALAVAGDRMPDPSASEEDWGKWLAQTSGTALGHALAELAGPDRGYPFANEIAGWISRYFGAGSTEAAGLGATEESDRFYGQLRTSLDATDRGDTNAAM
jgi:tetratricopeptide (TPR) repeat protein